MCIFLRLMFILISVISMENSKEMLSFILKTTQMSQIGIRSILSCTMRPSLRNILESQLQEYDSIESEAHAIAALRGWELPDADPITRILLSMKTRCKLSRSNPDRKIADLVIQRNKKEFSSGMKHHENFGTRDLNVSTLSQKLLDCLTANIRQMQWFL